MCTIYVASLWTQHITDIIRKSFTRHRINVSLVSLRSYSDDKSVNYEVDVPELEDVEFASKIELIFIDMPILAKYRKNLTNLKWAHTPWNGVDILMDSFDKDEPLPTYPLTKTPGSKNAALITEYVIGYIIANERSMFAGIELQKHKTWNQADMVSNTHALSTRSIGILGVGEIGKHLARVCKAFGMTVWGLTRRKHTAETSCQYVDEYRTNEGLSDILQNCDYICNILPSTSSSRDLLSGDVLRHCSNKKSIFINVGRGDVIDEASIVRAIKNGWLGGAVLDVFKTEPLPESSPLWELPNVVITPHTSGWSSSESHMESVLECFLDNYKRYVEGRPLQGVLDWSQGY